MDRRDFELLRDEEIPELNTRALLYRHRTGCEIVSLINDDENKVFGINFPHSADRFDRHCPHPRTLGAVRLAQVPGQGAVCRADQRLAQHLPQRLHLSRQNLLPGRQHQFAGILQPDRRVSRRRLPSARLTPEVLQQEGWHYELEDPSDPLRYKGVVVFNEMKGAYSDPERFLGERIQQSIFPGHHLWRGFRRRPAPHPSPHL